MLKTEMDIFNGYFLVNISVFKSQLNQILFNMENTKVNFNKLLSIENMLRSNIIFFIKHLWWHLVRWDAPKQVILCLETLSFITLFHRNFSYSWIYFKIAFWKHVSIKFSFYFVDIFSKTFLLFKFLSYFLQAVRDTAIYWITVKERATLAVIVSNRSRQSKILNRKSVPRKIFRKFCLNLSVKRIR